MSYEEIIYKKDVFPSIEMNHIHTKSEISTTEEQDNHIDNIFKYNIIGGPTTNVDEISEGKKKVRFPEESNIVSDYFEARNYWQEQRFCSCEELMSSYKKACEFYSIKPIPILLEQIKGIDVGLCNERYDMLNLSNVKLDLKHVESMEEIFKRVQFKSLNFENTTLDDESASSLFEIIEYYESCLKLNLSHNSKISYVGFNACSKMLKKTPCLDTIELKGIIFTDSTIPPLNRALRCGSNLKALHLENSNICSKNLLILASALKLNVHLRELHLSGNRMVPSDGIQLGSLLKVNRLLETLDVRNNSLGDVGLSHICDGISDQFQTHRPDNENQGRGLVCLILWSNSITYNGMPSLSDALKATKSLQSLNLGNNPISSEGVHILREGLLSNRTLIRLSLPCCRITCEGGVAIAEYLADTKQLMRLDIRDNDIRTAGLMAISLSMKVNKSLTRLDVDPSPKKDPNVKGFVETQTESLKIIQQRVQDNKKVTSDKQDLELSQSLISLSNQPQDAVELITDVNTTLSAPDDSSDSNQIQNLDPDNGSQSVNDIGSVTDRQFAATKVPMSLDLSPDVDTSIAFLGNFANKILSPTDTMLNYKSQPMTDFTNIPVYNDSNNDDNGDWNVEPIPDGDPIHDYTSHSNINDGDDDNDKEAVPKNLVIIQEEDKVDEAFAELVLVPDLLLNNNNDWEKEEMTPSDSAADNDFEKIEKFVKDDVPNDLVEPPLDVNFIAEDANTSLQEPLTKDLAVTEEMSVSNATDL